MERRKWGPFSTLLGIFQTALLPASFTWTEVFLKCISCCLACTALAIDACISAHCSLSPLLHPLQAEKSQHGWSACLELNLGFWCAKTQPVLKLLLIWIMPCLSFFTVSLVVSSEWVCGRLSSLCFSLLCVVNLIVCLRNFTLVQIWSGCIWQKCSW